MNISQLAFKIPQTIIANPSGKFMHGKEQIPTTKIISILSNLSQQDALTLKKDQTSIFAVLDYVDTLLEARGKIITTKNPKQVEREKHQLQSIKNLFMQKLGAHTPSSSYNDEAKEMHAETPDGISLTRKSDGTVVAKQESNNNLPTNSKELTSLTLQAQSDLTRYGISFQNGETPTGETPLEKCKSFLSSHLNDDQIQSCLKDIPSATSHLYSHSSNPKDILLQHILLTQSPARLMSEAAMHLGISIPSDFEKNSIMLSIQDGHPIWEFDLKNITTKDSSLTLRSIDLYSICDAITGQAKVTITIKPSTQ